MSTEPTHDVLPVNDRERSERVLRALAPVSRLLNRVALVMLREDVGGQGRHVDPDAPGAPPPATARWTTAHAAAVASPTMEHFRSALRPVGGGTEREGVLDDLARYFSISSEEALARCLDWESASLQEWEAAPRDSVDGIAGFYASATSWAFDLSWYNYLQVSGTGYPKSVIVADRLRIASGMRVLDYGSGVGATAQLFAALGCEVTLADVAKPLLDFARWRLDERGTPARYVHLAAALPVASFDVVTALDVMAHVPPEELRGTVEAIHAALRSGGLFVTGFDVRRKSRRNAWHLYDDDLPLRWEIARAGFRRADLIDAGVWIYRAGSTRGVRGRAHIAWAWVRLASPPARLLRRCRRVVARAGLTVFFLVAARR
ncbi:bifunctional 2-polyprenyl-6-hydroxyphenol methylase/3-demethylubiquinol 3-O-methyltransferase UbiG [Pseudonocardia sp. WMMC193]|uniref:class I SAM-dependent methyltransferase n=1 Tax=Pseudonocardia sp. WMMC193 TaxID=2911965 RepID=UPI001F23AB95|nr:class I SAM-dependent methyltransferase [Pseudonocardia sp. WMMC193]MCF7553734.1 class I SAM-dependent methyltransferase [Pseudonocardia sp. WMMC193]